MPLVSQASAPLRVMPIGDSITEATHGDATYRYFLWRDLNLAGCPTDFVGSKRGVRTGQPRFPAFDQDHESYWGKRVDELLPLVQGWVRNAQPDVILVHLGTNDMLQGQPVAQTVAELGSFIDELRAGQPEVAIFLAQVIPVIAWRGVAVEPLNQALPGLVAAKTTASSPVVLVDQYTGFDPMAHTYDGIHPNFFGDQRLADVWFRALTAWLAPRIGTVAPFGQGCAGTRGTPPALGSQGRPVLGEVFSIAASGLDPQGGVVLGMVGADRTAWLGLPLPLPLGALGMPGCSLWIAPTFSLSVPKARGSASLPLRLPTDPAFAGASFYAQVLDVRRGANPIGLVSSNALAVRIGLK